ncbi:hypothetical protein EUTSA_v10016139mg [Eutrema salsugineum]|uniref:HhH-GPD domain-containing protein n=1 Tax=Eutrema salsugineum TaxID=72664 RepID=V4M7J3_EUTSA|nr:protein ROS1 [Eutrema salsugineum]ESQ52279.1 hypothetical protein EUTSA_v10016139mg [Eutrema salsugineum]
MEKRNIEESSSNQIPWIPQTPIKPIDPIYTNWNQTMEGRFVGNEDMDGLDNLSFGDLLALANTASSVFFSGQRQTGIDQRQMVYGEMLEKGDEGGEILIPVSDNVDEQIKTPEKPKRKKHRPKVVKEAKPKRDPKPKTPRKPAGEGQETKTPKRKYVRRKKVEADRNQESTPVEESAAVEASAPAKKVCRRALDFEDESFKPKSSENDTKHADETELASRGKQSDSGNQESKDCLIPLPSTPKRKQSQSRRMGKEQKNSGAQAAKRRQRKEPTCDMNPSGILYDELCEYEKMHWLYFTDGQQKEMRSDAICSAPFTGQRLDAEEDVSGFDSRCYGFTSQASASRVLTMEENCEGASHGRQSFETNVRLDKIDKPIKKKTTGHARFRNLSSIVKVTEVSEKLQGGGYNRPQNNNNVLVERRVTLSKKKRAAKSEISQTNQITLHPNLGRSPPSFADLPPDEIWKQLYSVEAICEYLRVLDINRENEMNSTGNQIVLFTGGAGAIVPAAPVKKRRPRAKVDLDNETDRVWNLLMDSIDSEGVDGSDEHKARWWEEERSVFRGRADSFIARMHLVQGDRRFTPWKGSVVDSVVGVFLTQNVSDHLSSSAFMSLASEFPPPEVPSSNFDVGTCSVPPIRITYLDSEESISNPPVHNHTQPDEEKDYDSSRSSSEIASSAHVSVGKTMDSKTHVDSDQKRSSVEVDKTDQTYHVQDLFPSDDSTLTCQNSLVSDAPQRAGSSSEINSKGEHYSSYVKLLQSLGSAQLHGKGRDIITSDTVSAEESNQKNHQYDNSRQENGVSSNHGSLQVSPNTSPGDYSSGVKDLESLKGQTKSSGDSNEPFCCFGDVFKYQTPEMPASSSSVPSTKNKEGPVMETLIPDLNESTSCIHLRECTEKPPGHDSRQHGDSSCKELNPKYEATTLKAKGKKVLKKGKEGFDWDSLRREAEARAGKREKTTRTMDTVDWEAIRTADVSEVAETIKSRGMNHKLAERIQAFLNRLVTEHGSIDLEWLRDVPPDKAKEYLLSFNGLGLKSVECVRLLTLHHLAFPVDTNVGRIAVRLGWVPLQPLPESLQLHLLEMYPVLESIQKYLWPRLCKLDQKTLYELHYQLITFGKVFCTKSKPNCNACPMKGECRHFASAFASARLALPGPEKDMTPDKNTLALPEALQRNQGSEVVMHSELANKPTCCEPIIEEPSSPELKCQEVSIGDIEDAFYEDQEEIPTIRLNLDAFTNNLKKIIERSGELQDGDMSTALVALTAEAASIPMPKLKDISLLRTEHLVYELGDSHPLLAELEKREPDDPCSYLLAIWTPGETVDSIEPAVSKCISQGNGNLCDDETCLSCNSVKEARSQTVRGTILIPCRTAMRGSFPLNGTYFQVNEVFADHDSSLNPINIPRDWLWKLPRKTVYFGTSIPSIFKGLPTEKIQHAFWRGYVCVRGFDRKTRGPKPLIARLHFPASRMKSQSQANPPT